MRLLFALPLLLTIAWPTLSQNAGNSLPEIPKEPYAIFAKAAPFYDFTSSDLKPWHLKASYQLYDEKGKPSEQGTYEYWWVSPEVCRRFRIAFWPAKFRCLKERRRSSPRRWMK